MPHQEYPPIHIIPSIDYIKKGLTSAHAQNLKDYFTMWTNGAKFHKLKFMYVYTCPMTGEHFACRNWMNNCGGEVVDVEDQLFWYSELLFMTLHLGFCAVYFISSLLT